MDSFLFSLNVVFPLFVLISIGYFLARIKVTTPSFVKTANSVCFKVFLPILLFKNIYQADFSTAFNSQFIMTVIAFAAVQIAFLFCIVPVLVRSNARRGVIIQALFRGNYLIFGVPICQTLFGDNGGAVAATVAAFLVPFYNVMAVIVLSVFDSEKKISLVQTLKKVITNPLIIGAMLGLLFSFFKIPIPEAVYTPVSQLGSIATPLALMLLGCDFSFKGAFKNLGYVLTVSLARLVATPAIALTIAVMMGIRNEQLAVMMIAFGSPVAVSSYTMACNANADHELAGQLVVVTSLFSIFSMFGIVYIMRLIGLY